MGEMFSIEAADTATSSERLLELSSDRQLHHLIVANPNISEALLFELANSYPEEAASNPVFQLLELSGELWWEKCEPSTLLRLLAVTGLSCNRKARKYLADLIWDDLTDSPIQINIEWHLSMQQSVECSTPSFPEGLIDLLSFNGAFELSGGSFVQVESLSSSAPLVISLKQVSVEQDCEKLYLFGLSAPEGELNARISAQRDGAFICSELAVIKCDLEEWGMDDCESPRGMDDLCRKVLEKMLANAAKPGFVVSLGAIVEENLADLASLSRNPPGHGQELLKIIQALGVSEGASINLNALPQFDYEIDYTPGGQGYWDVEKVVPELPCWTFDANLDGMGEGSITITGASGHIYEVDVEQEPDSNYLNPTLKEDLASRLLDGEFTAEELGSLLLKALLAA